MARDEEAVDVTITWLLLSSGDNPANRLKAAVTDRFRGRLIRSFLGPFDRDRLPAVLPEVAAWKAADPNMTEAERPSGRAAERVAVRAFARREGRSALPTR